MKMKILTQKYLGKCEKCGEPFNTFYGDPETFCDDCAAEEALIEQQETAYNDD